MYFSSFVFFWDFSEISALKDLFKKDHPVEPDGLSEVWRFRYSPSKYLSNIELLIYRTRYNIGTCLALPPSPDIPVFVACCY